MAIDEELTAQIEIGRLEREDGAAITATVIADVVWCGFRVRSGRRAAAGGYGVDAAEVEYDRAEQLYVAGVREWLPAGEVRQEAEAVEVLLQPLWEQLAQAHSAD